MLTKKKIKQPLPRTTYRRDADTYKILANPKRLEILSLLHEQELSVEDLACTLGVPKANVSQHLALLRRAHLVTVRKEGLNRYYNISDPRVIESRRLLHELVHSM
jgi:ArsR family transcriptional regulator